ncbi:MAG: AAA family ATPase [Clostridia bacterium]|nr:AAA family ATPase [Clostridia bacterium]
MIKEIEIDRVRHLAGIPIPIVNDAETGVRHLLLTGKNGSGKTSVLDALASYLNACCQDRFFFQYESFIADGQSKLDGFIRDEASMAEIENLKHDIQSWKETLEQERQGVRLSFVNNAEAMPFAFTAGKFILAYFKADRAFVADKPEHVEKVQLKENYAIMDEPRKLFIKYLVDRKVSQSLLQTNNEAEKADRIRVWFDQFEQMLREVFEDDTLRLDFDVNTFEFRIREKGKEPYDFNAMSAGYAAIIDIVVNIIMRMEEGTGNSFCFDMPGIVLIDELETHLHYQLQRKILPFLTRVFPHVQFIVSTHSAFILSSIDNATIYDLENNTLVKDGLSNIPYEGIVEGYFDAPTLSTQLKEKFERYKQLAQKDAVSDDELLEMQKLSLYLDEIPDYLALEIATEYRRLKLEFEMREGK